MSGYAQTGSLLGRFMKKFTSLTNCTLSRNIGTYGMSPWRATCVMAITRSVAWNCTWLPSDFSAAMRYRPSPSRSMDRTSCSRWIDAPALVMDAASVFGSVS